MSFGRVFDSEGRQISTISSNLTFQDIEYALPSVVVDILNISKKESAPIISRVSDYNVLKKHGLVIISLKIPVSKRWIKRQRIMYRLAFKTDIPEGANTLPASPSHHYVEYDSANNKMRLTGLLSGVNGYGEWINL